MRVLRFVEPIKTTNSKTFLATLASLISRLNDRVTTFHQSRFFSPTVARHVKIEIIFRELESQSYSLNVKSHLKSHQNSPV